MLSLLCSDLTSSIVILLVTAESVINVLQLRIRNNVLYSSLFLTVVRNGLLAEEAQTIEDQLQLPVQTALPEDLQPVTDNEEQDVLLATEAQEDLCFHEDKDPWMEDVAPIDPAEICAELEASEEAVETLPQEDAGPIETPPGDASVDQPLNEASQKEPEFVAMLAETVALVEEVSAETAPEVTIGSAETTGSEPLEALMVEEEVAVVTSDQAAGPGTTMSTEPVLSGSTAPVTTEPTEPGSSETTDHATAEPTEPVPDEEAEKAPTVPTEPAPSKPTDLVTDEPTEPVPGDKPEQAPIIQTESGPSDEAVSETTETASSESAGPVPNEAVGPESSDNTEPAPSEDRGPTTETMEPSPSRETEQASIDSKGPEPSEEAALPLGEPIEPVSSKSAGPVPCDNAEPTLSEDRGPKTTETAESLPSPEAEQATIETKGTEPSEDVNPPLSETIEPALSNEASRPEPCDDIEPSSTEDAGQITTKETEPELNEPAEQTPLEASGPSPNDSAEPVEPVETVPPSETTTGNEVLGVTPVPAEAAEPLTKEAAVGSVSGEVVAACEDAVATLDLAPDAAVAPDAQAAATTMEAMPVKCLSLVIDPEIALATIPQLPPSPPPTGTTEGHHPLPEEEGTAVEASCPTEPTHAPAPKDRLPVATPDQEEEFPASRPKEAEKVVSSPLAEASMDESTSSEPASMKPSTVMLS